MTLKQKQQDSIDEFAIFDDWIRESTAFEDQALAPGRCEIIKTSKR